MTDRVDQGCGRNHTLVIPARRALKPISGPWHTGRLVDHEGLALIEMTDIARERTEWVMR